ncbi:uncharacterized protein BT62DRAFT_921985 [Guyanagaster necrorhizus]|uniref:Uncharacterized protein n=1 Tax=Guyanagaster necrorhizus TaxID=856835 RepID=A0A9P8APN2_9AGAR|nr:uncharacterized protein BT62DRAFT_921985 [Guyanagaster necrorhizus MCA 3950]KAG7443523.1 hypothetical protein BT62DRAFT_921985 [Guyanagaster necrorhizus MCA 3950]
MIEADVLLIVIVDKLSNDSTSEKSSECVGRDSQHWRFIGEGDIAELEVPLAQYSGVLLHKVLGSLKMGVEREGSAHTSLQLIPLPMLFLLDSFIIVKGNSKVSGWEVPAHGFFPLFLSSLSIIRLVGNVFSHPGIDGCGGTGAMRLAARCWCMGSWSHLRGIKRVLGMIGNPMGLGGRRGGGGVLKEVLWEVLGLRGVFWYKDSIPSWDAMVPVSGSREVLSSLFFLTIPLMHAARFSF